MHLGEEDEFISKAAQAEIKAALAGKANATVYSYPGQRHAFSRHNGAHYDAAAATLANARRLVVTVGNSIRLASEVELGDALG
jgi:carboxymethylenebutenolidase